MIYYKQDLFDIIATLDIFGKYALFKEDLIYIGYLYIYI